MRFVVDAQLPPALARWLAGRGHDAWHVADLGLASATDETIWAYAEAREICIVTKDEDFAYRRIRTDSGPQVIWVRLRNTRTAALLVWFERAMPQVEAMALRSEPLIELL